LIGLPVVNALKPSGPNIWSGLVYNADDGRTYKANLKLESEGVAKVKGWRALQDAHVDAREVSLGDKWRSTGPGRGAARSGALQTRDRRELRD
jgi:hypothetical protein